MCAALAGQRGRRVLLIEHYRIVGEKIRISGGGRCNFTNIHVEPGELSFAAIPTSAARRSPATRRAISCARRAPRHPLAREEARPAVLRRVRAADHRDAEDRMRARRRDVVAAVCGRRRRSRGRSRSPSTTPRGHGARVVAGGRHRRTLGAEDRRDAVRLRLAEQFGLAVVPPRPALVPLAFAPDAARALRRSVRDLGRRRGRRATAAGFARTCCSRIAAFRARRSCRSRRTGTDATPLADRPRCRASMSRAWLRIARAQRRAGCDNLLARRLPERFAQRGAKRTTRPAGARARRREARSDVARALHRLAASCRRARSAATRPK